MHFENTQEIKKCLDRFKKLYDIIRFVDPISKEILYIDENSAFHNKHLCHEFWKNNTLCNNCISSRALNEDKSFTKIEYNKKNIFLIISCPITIGENKYIVEMLKDITDSGIVPDLKYKTTDEISEIIKKLNKEVITDELTDVYNRRYLNERLPFDIFNAIKNKTKLSVIMLDVDFFKKFNDTYGHLAGDFVLKEICAIIKSNIRKDIDWASRFGGEEFFVSLPGASNKAVYRIAEAIRKEIEGREIKYEDKILHITISAGVYTLESEKLSTNEVIAKADKNLYDAKQRGRNTVV